MKIVVDAMGGDNAPWAEIEGAVSALSFDNIEKIILVGKRTLIEEGLRKYNLNNFSGAISIEDASDVIGMDEQPSVAIRTKPNSSIAVSAYLVKEKKADAFVSAGNTGAIMGEALLKLGRLKTVLRPAIATLIPTQKDPCLLIDVGANVDCKPHHLYQFSLMGDVYAREILHRSSPKIGLLSIGGESSKGNKLTYEAFKYISNSSLNFIGNVEGRDIVTGRVDVVVCDGFVGNVLLKFGESLVEMVFDVIKREASLSWFKKLGIFLMRPCLKKLWQMVDYTEYGGAPLLGINGVCIICHGSSPAKAIKNAIKLAAEFVNHNVNTHIEERIKKEGLFRHQIVEVRGKDS